MTSILWFRRDLRLADNPAMLAALGQLNDSGAPQGSVLALYVLDPALWAPASPTRRAYLLDSLASLNADLDGNLVLRWGNPEQVVCDLAHEVEAEAVHIAADFGPYGSRRDASVKQRLEGIGVDLVATGSAYAVAPGRVRKSDGERYRVFTPFRAAWLDHGWRAPVAKPSNPEWIAPADLSTPDLPVPARPDITVPRAGEAAALHRWADFLDQGLNTYATDRDRPDRPGTSHLSTALKWGEIHPRTLLADLSRVAQEGKASDGVASYRSELAWREFYADVLWHQPETARTSMREVAAADLWLTGDERSAALRTWEAGQTGYPLVDAGMRHLLATGWMPGRVRMVVASFLVKDLHVPWQLGARHFMAHLLDGDLASNSHNWQWVAGTGTDAAPFFRIFNPTTQGKTFDPNGSYVRQWVPELRGIPGAAVHEPWKLKESPPGYPAPMVDHGVQRGITLDAHSRRPR